jgi:DNA-binding LacI/PurR family transcriptional regulator
MTRVKAPTIYDVAQHAGVSHQTVSRFLSGTGGVRPANRERVEAALVALGYRRNNTARSLATSRTFRLGALVHELSGNGPGRAVQGASEAAREAGYALDIVSLDPFGQDDLPGALELLEGRDLEGILATAPTAAVERALRSLNIPYPIYIDQGSDEDLERGVRAALDHLADLGHRRIAHLAGPAEWRSAQARLDHYLKWMSRRGLAPLPVQNGDWTASSGYAVADQLMAEAQPTAIFVGNDRMALGLMLRLHERGVAIPGDVSIVGYDDVAEAEFFHPPLTTIRQDFDAMGRAAISELILLVEAGDAGRGVEHPASELIVRESTGPASP